MTAITQQCKTFTVIRHSETEFEELFLKPHIYLFKRLSVDSVFKILCSWQKLDECHLCSRRADIRGQETPLSTLIDSGEWQTDRLCGIRNERRRSHNFEYTFDGGNRSRLIGLWFAMFRTLSNDNKSVFIGILKTFVWKIFDQYTMLKWWPSDLYPLQLNIRNGTACLLVKTFPEKLSVNTSRTPYLRS